MSKLVWRKLNSIELKRLRVFLADIKITHLSGCDMGDNDNDDIGEINYLSYDFRCDNDCRSLMNKETIIGNNRNWYSDYPQYVFSKYDYNPLKFDILGDYIYTYDYSDKILECCPFLYMKIFNIKDADFFKVDRDWETL